MKKLLTFLGLALVALLVYSLAGLPSASPAQAQAVYETPTPGADGRILYTVKAGDTCISISLLTGISQDKLRQLNNIQGTDCTLQVGQELLLGTGGPSGGTPTPGPSLTPTPILPSSTPFNGNGEVCILLYNDVNGDAVRQTEEVAIPGGAISLTDRLGKYSQTGTTVAGTDPVCFSDVPEGDYNVSVAVPQGYNPTTVMNYALSVKAGDQSILDFGAQTSSQAAPVTPSDGGHSPMLGVLGGALLLIGAGLAIYVRRLRH